MQASFKALYAIYLRTLLLVDPKFRANVELNRPRMPPEALAELPDLGSAVKLVTAEDADGWRYRMHAALALSVAYWSLRRGESPDAVQANAEEVAALLEQLGFDTGLLDDARSLPGAFIAPLKTRYPVKNFWIRTVFHSGTEAAAGAAGIQVARPVTDFATAADPRNWHATAPDMFDQSFRIAAPPLDAWDTPADADQGLVPPALVERGAPWQGLIWEQAVLSSGAMDVVLRNALRVNVQNFKLTPPAVPPAPHTPVPTYRLAYSLYESISHETKLAGTTLNRGFGGLDRDSGFFDVSDMRDTYTSVAAKKSLRFTGELEWMNVLNPAGLFLWMTLETFTIACYQFGP